MYAKPSGLLADMVLALPVNEKLNEDQELFMLRFGDVLDKVYDEARLLVYVFLDQELPMVVLF